MQVHTGAIQCLSRVREHIWRIELTGIDDAVGHNVIERCPSADNNAAIKGGLRIDSEYVGAPDDAASRVRENQTAPTSESGSRTQGRGRGCGGKEQTGVNASHLLNRAALLRVDPFIVDE